MKNALEDVIQCGYLRGYMVDKDTQGEWLAQQTRIEEKKEEEELDGVETELNSLIGKITR